MSPYLYYIGVEIILRKIREQRQRAGLTQEQVGNHLGLAKETYHNIENGKIRLKLDDFISICQLLHLPYASVLESDEQTITITKADFIVIQNAFKVIERIAETNDLKNTSNPLPKNEYELSDSIDDEEK